ncbi:hypothetical protein OF897_20945 [Chryseobacterium formosus]|uniref:Uncharacterized protein n=1 Tax=Chryseobacterium formosus TaxID=1537363 RepID=A0ABT3XXM0_9FLAO|nr:hypothetical protein [Chryseobacterium formosus]
MKDSQKYFEKIWTKVSEEKQQMDSATDSRIWRGIDERIKQNNKRKYYWMAAAAVLVPLFGILFFTKILNQKKRKIVCQQSYCKPMKFLKLSDCLIIALSPWSLTVNYPSIKILERNTEM